MQNATEWAPFGEHNPVMGPPLSRDPGSEISGTSPSNICQQDALSVPHHLYAKLLSLLSLVSHHPRAGLSTLTVLRFDRI